MEHPWSETAENCLWKLRMKPAVGCSAENAQIKTVRFFSTAAGCSAEMRGKNVMETVNFEPSQMHMMMVVPRLILMETVKFAGKPWKLSTKKSQVIGKNSVNRILVQIAAWCGHKNPTRCTAHGKWGQGLSDAANGAGVSGAAMLTLGGHASHATSAGFPFVRVRENCNGQKGNALTLKNFKVDVTNARKKTCPCPFSSCPLSPFQTITTIMKCWLPPKDQLEDGNTRFF